MQQAHVRIDDGVKRGPRKQGRRPPIDPQTGRFTPLLPHAERLQAVQAAAHRIEAGETLADIAKDIGVTKQALSLWLLDDIPDQYKAAQRRGLIGKIVECDRALEEAATPLDLARAREQARFARWDAERRLSGLFGQKQEVTHNLPAGPVLTINLNAAPQLVQSNTPSNVIDATPITE